jgi:hypothetical protein
MYMLRIVGLAVLLVMGLSLFGQPQLNMLKTDNLKLVYFPPHSYIVPHVARCFHNALDFHTKIFNYQPSEDILLFLHSFNDYGSAGASTIPWNFITVCMEPFDYVYETRPANERMNWLTTHELVHIVAGDRATGSDLFYRSIFLGKVAPTSEYPISMLYSYLTNPRWYSARWYHEGIAVFMETWMTGGRGRALGGYDEMVFRTMARDDSYFYDFVGLESEGTTIDFQIGANSYLYGTRFVSYLVHEYGPEKFINWVKRDEGSKRYYTSQFRHIYGTSVDDEWSRWIRWEKEWQNQNLNNIRKNPVTRHRKIYGGVLGSLSRAYYNHERNVLYAGINYPGKIAHIATIELSTGGIERLQTITTPALYYVSHLAFDPDTGNLFYTTNNSRGWRGLAMVNVSTKKSERLIENTRIGDLVFNKGDRSLWGVQHHNGLSRLVRIPHPYDEWNVILLLAYGRDILDLDISPDGKYLTGSLIEVSGETRLIRIEIEKLLANDSSFEILFDFEGNAPANFVYSPDGRYLFGTSYYSGVSNVFRYDFEAQDMVVITNAETGYFRPLPVSDDSLIVFEYTGKGFSPVMIANEPIEKVSAIRFLGQAIIENYPELESWSLGSPALIEVDSLTEYRGEYKVFSNIALASVYPVVEGYKDFAAFGLRFNISDRIGLHTLDLTTAFTPNTRLPYSERFHGSAQYRHWPWRITASYNRSDFYDLFGPTKTSRKGYSLGVQYQNIIRDDRPHRLDYTIHVAGYAGLEILPEFQNVATSFDKFLTASGRLNYSHLLRSLGSVEHEKGLTWSLNFHSTYVRDEYFPRIHTTFAYGIPLPLRHSSIWFRGATGYSVGDRVEPFANFFFGGFGNNWIDYQQVRRYREFYSFPGMELNAVGGTNFVKAMLEWALPPIRFRRFGFPMMYCNWTQLTLFSGGIVTNIDKDIDRSEIMNFGTRREIMNFGSQLDFQIVLFSMLESSLSFGFASAIEEHSKPSTEFMFSLKILR